MLNISLLVPSTRMIPRFGREFKASFELGLGEYSQKVRIDAEAGGLNTGARDLRNRMEQLILNKLPDLIVAPLNPQVLGELEPLIQAEEVPLVAVTLGENRLPQNLNQDFIRTKSYRLWESAWLTAYQGVKRFGPRVTLVSGFHDCGYGLGEAALQGAEAAGGRVVNNVITKEPKAERNSKRKEQTLSDIFEVESDVVILNYSGSGLTHLNDMISQIDEPKLLNYNAVFLALPMTVALSDVTAEHSQLNGLASFSAYELSALPLSAYTSDFFDRFKHHPHPYMVLAYLVGYDIAQSIGGAEEEGQLDENVFRRFPNLLNFSDLSNRFYESKLNLPKEHENLLSSQIISEVILPEACRDQSILSIEDSQVQGWANPYLIT